MSESIESVIAMEVLVGGGCVKGAEMAVEPFDPDRLVRALDWIDRVGYAATDDVAVVVALEAARALLDGLEVSWCEKHRSRFLEKQPSERSLCLYSLYEDNFIAVGWEDCVPVRARVVIERRKRNEQVGS